MSPLRREITALVLGLLVAAGAASPAAAAIGPDNQLGVLGCVSILPNLGSIGLVDMGPLGPMGPWGALGPLHGQKKPEPQCSLYGAGPGRG